MSPVTNLRVQWIHFSTNETYIFSHMQVHRELMPEHQHPTRETLRPNCVISTGNWKQRATAKDQES